MSTDFFNDFVFFLSAAYFSDPDQDVSFTAQFSKGFWLSELSLVHFALGPVLSNYNVLGGSGTVWVGIDKLIPFKSGVVFLQSDRYPNSRDGGTKWRYTLGVSFTI